MERQDATPIISALKNLGVSMEELATELKVSYPTVHKWSKGKSKPNYSTYQNMLLIFHRAKKRAQKEAENENI